MLRFKERLKKLHYVHDYFIVTLYADGKPLLIQRVNCKTRSVTLIKP